MNELTIPPTLQMDDTWTVFDGVTDNMAKFIKQFMPDMFLKPEVHKDVVENFRVVRKLVECSFFEYKIYDVGVLKTALTMEMAMKLRYNELNPEKWDNKKPLFQLIKWFEERNYFEAYYPEYMDNMRKIRNTLAHPNEHSFGGASGVNLIERIVDIVNGLYEDPALRTFRKQKTLEIIKVIESFHGRMVCTEGDKRYLVYRAWPGFVNNKNDSLEIHFYYKPTCTYSDKFMEENNLAWAPVLYFKANSIEINKDSILLKNEQGGHLLLTAFKDEKDDDAFEHWSARYGPISDKTGEFILIDDEVTDPFFMHLREFHRTENRISGSDT